MTRYSIGVDMGGTNLRAAAVGEDNRHHANRPPRPEDSAMIARDNPAALIGAVVMATNPPIAPTLDRELPKLNPDIRDRVAAVLTKKEAAR